MSKDYPQSEEAKLKKKISSLKRKVRRLEKSLDEALSENKTFKKTWKKTEQFLKEATKDIPLEDILKYNKLPKKAVRKMDKERNKLTAKEKWQKWRKENQ